MSIFYHRRISKWGIFSFNVIAFILVLLLLSPFAQVFADDITPPVDTSSTDTTTPVVQDSTTKIDTPPATTDDTTPPVSSTDTTTTDVPAKTDSTISPNTKMSSMSLIGPGGNALSSGDTDETKHLVPNVDQTTGALNYRYDLDIPPGRSNLTPDLGLTYNSQDANNQSVFGYGWNVSIPYITRVNKHGSSELYTNNYPTFTSSISGELIQTSQTNPSVNPEEGTYSPKTENGDFLSYSYASSVWTIKDKSGTTYKYGGTAGARQDDAGATSHIYKWMLSETRDMNNNYISYSYYKNAGQIYPDTIVYTGNGSTAGIFEVDFLRQTRTDSIDSRQTAFSNLPAYQVNEIDVKVSGTWVRKYVLAYSTNTNGVQSLLTSITKSGRDSLGTTTTLPAETFDYNQALSTNTWTHSSTISIPVDVNGGGTLHINLEGYGSTVTPMDVNGDGLMDFVQAYRTSTTTEDQSIYLNTGNGWTLSSTWAMPIDAADAGTLHVALNGISNLGIRAIPMDVNGDGLPDLVQSFRTTSTTEIQNIYLNTGSGWSLSSTWAMPIDSNAGGTLHINLNGYGSTVTPVDVNGDGLIDFVQAYRTSTTTEDQSIYLNNGSGWTLSTTWAMPIDASDAGTLHVPFSNSASNLGFPAIPMDINSDGLPDLVQSYRSGSSEIQYIYLNNGNGWTLSSTWAMPVDANAPTMHVALTGNAPFGVLLDINGDGLPDIVQAYRSGGTSEIQNIYLNTGTGWTLSTGGWAMPIDSADLGTLHIGLNGPGSGTGFPGIPIDVNGDGLPDLAQMYRGSTGSSPAEYENVYINGGAFSLLSKITIPSGGTEQITYKQISASGTSNKVPQQVMVVSSTTTTDTVTGVSGTTTYQYNNGTYAYGNAFDRKFAGFGLVTTTDPAGNVTKTYYHTGTGTDTTHGEYSDDYYKIGKVYRAEQYDASNNLYAKTINKWDEYSIATGTKFVKLAQSVQSTYDGDSTHKDKATAYTYDNTTGNVTQKVDYGVVTGNDDGTLTDSGTDDFTTASSYTNDTTDHIFLPYDVTVTDHSAAKVKEDRYYYDVQTLGNVTKGNQTKHEMWVTGTTYINTQKSYDATYGVVLSDTDGRSKVTNYTLDTNHLYPATVTDPLTHATSYTYDYATGQVIQKTDPNTLVFQWVYDGLGRLLTVKVPDLTTPTTLDTKTAYQYTDTSGAVKVRQADFLDSVTTVYTYTYFDGLHRKLQTKKQAEASKYETTDYLYNSLGLLQKQSIPYLITGSAKSTATTTTSLYTNYTYDPMYRVLTVIDNIGTTTNTYNDWKLTTTDPRSKIKDLYKDAYDNLIEVDEHNSGSTYSTYYTYNGLGKLLSITDSLSNVRNFTYNSLGQRLTAQDLHASADSTFGSWSYTYDNAGNLTQSISPLAKTVNYTYDDTNRILTEDYTGATGTEITYVYDTCTDGIGYLCSVTMTSGANTTYTYDANGNEASETKTINTVGYTTSYTHDRQGNVLIITYPDSAQVRYTYVTATLLNQIEREESGGSFSNVISNIDYSPTEQPTIITYANGTTTTNTYDSAHLYRLSNKTTVNGVPTNLQNIAYTYDADNNITKIVDSSNTDASKTVNYTYDDLNRMLTATATAVASGQTTYTHTFVYNAIGDITSGPVGTYVYNGSTGTNYANPHAATSINGVTNTYDKDGNVLTDGTLTNTWNYKDQLVTSTNGTFTRTYLYDQDGNRVSSANGTTTTVYPNKYYTYDGTTKTKDIYMGSTLVATITTASATVTPYYVHTDTVLGSNVISDSTGAKNQLLDYFPYGQVRINQQAASFNEQKQYIGQEYDADTALNYLNARYYKSSVGQFISEDSIFWQLGQTRDGTDALSNPQLLNSYSYAGDSPITNSDPSGKWWKEWAFGFGKQSTSDFRLEVGQATQYLTDHNQAWNYAVNNPVKAGAIVGLAAGTTALVAAPAVEAFSSSVVIVSGVGRVVVTNRIIEGSIYTYLTASTLKSLPENLNRAAALKSGNLSSYGQFVGGYALDYVPSFSGKTIDAISSIGQLVSSAINNITSLAQKQEKKDNKK